MLEPVVAATKGQLSVTYEAHFARTVSTAPVVAIFVATVVMKVVILVDDCQSIALGSTKCHIDGGVSQHLPPSIDSLPAIQSIHIFHSSFFKLLSISAILSGSDETIHLR